MAEPFLSEIRIMSFDFPPKGWAFCDGALLPINQNQALFSLLGPNYGGNGQTNFALPDLRSRVPIHMGPGHTLGERAGQAAHTLTQSEMPQHIHFLQASSNATNGSATPSNNFLGGGNNVYHAPNVGGLTTFSPEVILPVGGSQPHENRQPYTTLNFCIATQGIFPSQN